MTNPKDITLPIGVTLKKFTGLWDQASNSLHEYCPPDSDHQKEDNHYKSKFGDEWKHHLEKSVVFSHTETIYD